MCGMKIGEHLMVRQLEERMRERLEAADRRTRGEGRGTPGSAHRRRAHRAGGGFGMSTSHYGDPGHGMTDQFRGRVAAEREAELDRAGGWRGRWPSRRNGRARILCRSSGTSCRPSSGSRRREWSGTTRRGWKRGGRGWIRRWCSGRPRRGWRGRSLGRRRSTAPRRWRQGSPRDGELLRAAHRGRAGSGQALRRAACGLESGGRARRRRRGPTAITRPGHGNVAAISR